MSREAFLDTNVLIYAATASGPNAAIAAALLAQGCVLSVQVLNEFASVARRKFLRPWSEVQEVLADIRVLCPSIRPIGLDTHDSALALADTEQLSFYDALIVAAALEAGCSTLWSEDMQDGREIAGRLTIRNPFAAGM